MLVIPSLLTLSAMFLINRLSALTEMQMVSSTIEASFHRIPLIPACEKSSMPESLQAARLPKKK